MSNQCYPVTSLAKPRKRPHNPLAKAESSASPTATPPNKKQKAQLPISKNSDAVIKTSSATTCNEHTSKLALISDTHGVLEESVLCYFRKGGSEEVDDDEGQLSRNASAILHAGDVGDRRQSRLKPHQVLQQLRSLSEMVVACRGNVDDDVPNSQASRLPQHVLYVDQTTKTRILILHGDGIPNQARISNKGSRNNDKTKNNNKDQKRSTKNIPHNNDNLYVSEEAWALIQQERAQVILYGHSHLIGCTLQRGVLFINPGSAGPKRFSLPRSCGTLTLTISNDSSSINNNNNSSGSITSSTSRPQQYTATAIVSYCVELVNIESGQLLLCKSGELAR